MSWAVGFDQNWSRDIGYGVPAICDFPDCEEEIDRGLGYVCGGEPLGGRNGCGLYFCGDHSNYRSLCERCETKQPSFEPKPDTLEWIEWKINHESWAEWREENPATVALYKARLKEAMP